MSRSKSILVIVMMALVMLASAGESVAQKVLVVKDAKVGINTENPDAPLHVYGTDDVFGGFGIDPSNANGTGLNFGYGGGSLGESSGFLNVRPGVNPPGRNPALLFATSNVVHMIIDKQGHIGLGPGLGFSPTGFDPAHPIHHTGGAHLSSAGEWKNASSRSLKEDIQPLNATDAFAAFAELQPVRFIYKANGERTVGFIAEDVPDLVASPDRKTLSPMDLVAVLTKVVQEQQERIQALESRLNEMVGDGR